MLWQHYESTTEIGHFQIKLRIYIDGKPRYKKTNIWVTVAQWDDAKQVVKSHPKAKEYNIRLKKIYNDHDKVITKAVVNETGITHDVFNAPKIGVKELVYLCIDKHNANFEWGKLESFAGENVSVHSLAQSDFLQRFEDWQIANDYAPGSIFMSMQRMKSVCTKAKGMGLTFANPYEKIPGLYYKPPKKVEIEKSFLLLEERNAFYNHFLANKGKDVTKDGKAGWKNGRRFEASEYYTLVYFLLGCFTALRVSDWYLFDVHTRVQSDGYIRLRAKKNDEWVVQKIGGKLRNVLEEIKRIGPLSVISYVTVTKYLRKLGEDLKIQKKITPHTARHSYGYMCAKNNVKKHIAQELMGISSDIIDVYYHLTGETTKEAADVMAED